MRTRRATKGSTLRQSFNEECARFSSEAESRRNAVIDRLAALEDEMADLRQLQRQLDAVQGQA